ncbi:MAG TPA: sulfatase-like hydrolase/transferase, partial [bacterium]|nr:sulfatase-like hydrolase/transferase [bacterium]
MEFIDRKRKRHPFSVAERKRPDIFVFTLDMVPPDFYRPGQLFSRISLPHWRRLEKTSVVFANAFSVSPLCSGSRASFFTGRYPYILVNEERSHDGFETELRPEEVIFPEYLKAAGYLTGHAGKSHIGT